MQVGYPQMVDTVALMSLGHRNERITEKNKLGSHPERGMLHRGIFTLLQNLKSSFTPYTERLVMYFVVCDCGLSVDIKHLVIIKTVFQEDAPPCQPFYLGPGLLPLKSCECLAVH